MKAYNQIITLQAQMEPTDWSLLCRQMEPTDWSLSAGTVASYRLVVICRHSCILQTGHYLQAQLYPTEWSLSADTNIAYGCKAFYAV
jgi:hypothetical protein